MVKQSIAIKTAKDYLQAVRAEGVNVHRAFLFGSFAKNRQHEWSDIDIALIGDNFIGVAALDKDSFRKLHLQPQFVSIETHTFPTERLKSGDPFLDEILKTGIEIN